MRSVWLSLNRIIRNPVLRVGVTVTCLWFLFRAVNSKQLFGVISNASLPWIIASELLLGGATAIQMIIWAFLLRARKRSLPPHQLVSLYLQGLFLANAVPGTISGDVYRCLRSAQLIGQRDAISSIIAGRAAELLGSLCVSLIAVFVMPAWFNSWRAAGAAVFALAAACLWHWMFRAKLGRQPTAARPHIAQRIAITVQQAINACVFYRAQRSVLPSSVLLGSINWLLVLLSLVCLSQAIDASVSWAVFAVAIPLSGLSAFIPVSVNGYGLREGILASILCLDGLPPAKALALALLVDVQLLPWIFAGLLFWLLDFKRVETLRPAE